MQDHMTQPTWIHELWFAGHHAIRCVNMAMEIITYGSPYLILLHIYSLERGPNYSKGYHLQNDAEYVQYIQ